MKIITIIGCGRVGRTLGYLFARRGVFRVGQVVNRTPSSSAAACGFIGQGTPGDLDALDQADVYLIGVPDDSIADTALALAEKNVIHGGEVVFHCSGSSSSDILAPLQNRGAQLASVHPVMSVADPRTAVSRFAGTPCGIEGDESACEILRAAFTAIGGTVFDLTTDRKMFYHAAAVIVCNYLTALLEVGLTCYEHAGIDRDMAARIIEPILKSTVDNALKLGTANGLTGPIARGDHRLVGEQHTALDQWNPDVGEVYRVLGRWALELSRKQGTASDGSLRMLEDILGTSSKGDQHGE
jgi:predicted short-subunit dehydrogenase-like oxidoreductase (DUF2520 family)